MNNNKPIEISELLSLIPVNKTKREDYFFLRNIVFTNKLKEYNSNNFFKNLIKFNEHKSIQFLDTLKSDYNDIEFIKKSAELRELANVIRERSRYESRVLDYVEVSEKGIAGEYFLKKYLYQNFKNNKNYQVSEPETASFNLDKRKQDFSIEPLFEFEQSVDFFTFDVKSQTVNSSNYCLNVNAESFSRIKKQSSFFIFALFSKKYEAVNFYLVDNKFFESKAIHIEKNSKVTEHYALSLDYFKINK